MAKTLEKIGQNRSNEGTKKVGWLVGWCLMSLFSTNTAISERREPKNIVNLTTTIC